ncbi:DUF3078 domain-containing protein [Weeksellaceae bacterium TAE3-ERU29]|nr:DUF3078 domain-containing protein [Weeksellaceae bacterium TAE3-ERU29]
MWLLRTFRNIIIITLFFIHYLTKAQVKDVFKEIKRIEFNIDKKKVEERRWKREGNLDVSFGQYYYDNWIGGGTGKLETFGKFSQKLSYQNNKIVWDNSLDIIYGMNKNYGEELKKTSDQVTFNSIFGRKESDNFSYSFFLNLRTQLTNSYLENKDKEEQYRISGFLAPLYIATGPGIMWRKSNNLVVNLAPASLRMTYLNGKVFEYDNSSKTFISNSEKQIYGVEAGEEINYQLGFYSSVYAKFNLFKNIGIENKLSLYSDYLNEPKNIDLDYVMNINFKVNKLISTNLLFQATYDDNVFSGFQIRQHFGVGFKLNL